ncbi:MAG: S-layer homology domain-containing protein [Saccharofermentans sp.]|nr:S-layer homology domain-containing protein [Saccharofermentans sp.]
MRRRIVSFILSLAMIASIGLYFQTNQVMADESLARYVMGAETLPDGKIAVLFIKGGSTESLGSNSSFHVVKNGTLYYMVYNPADNSWVEEPVGESAPAASEAALTLSNGVPHVVYVDSNKDIAYTYKTSEGWSAPSYIDSNNCNDKQGELVNPDIAVDADGVAHVSYMDTMGAVDDRYAYIDVMYANNATGAFINHVVQSCTGWFDSPDGQRWNSRDSFIALNDDGYVIPYWYSFWEKSAWGADTGYHAIIATSKGDYDFCDDWRNLSIYGALGKGNDSWAFVYNTHEGNYKIIRPYKTSEGYAFATDVLITHDNYPASVTMDASGNFYFAGIAGNSAVFYQNGTVTDLTTTNARFNSFNRVFTILSGSDQYLLYTSDDADRSLIISKFDGTSLSEYKVPNIMPEPTPSAVFEATGVDSGILTGVAAGMKYSIDGGETWIDITDTPVTIASGISVDTGIKVYQPATSALTANSAVQDVVVTKADTPALVPVQPAVINGKGSIPTTTAYEYSTDGTSYTACTGELTDLAPGTYYVRVKAAGTVLTSDAQEITISEFEPAFEPLPEAVFTAVDDNSGVLSNLEVGMRYHAKKNIYWITADSTSATLSDLTGGDLIEVYKPGNGTTTVDSYFQVIEVAKAAKPKLTAEQPSVIGGKGSIPTTSEHEYSTDGTTYTACTGELTDLAPGTYYIRVKVSGLTLASDPQEIEIVAFVPEKENTPSGTFFGIGTDSGYITGIDPDMQYSLDQGVTWINVGGETTSKAIDRGISVANGIWLKMPGNGITTIDSDIQKITVSKPDAPELTVVQPSVIGGKGSIATTDLQEYSTDGESYEPCNGELTDLDAGTYYIRFYGAQGSLASESTTVVIKEFEPAKETTPQAVFVKTGDESGKLTNVAAGMKYTIDGTNWIDITASTAVIESGVTTGTVIKVYMPGNNTTTIDSDAQIIEVPLCYKVTFETNGGNAIDPQYVPSNEKAVEPQTPVREGMVFNGWYIDEDFEYAFDFSNPILNNITIYADWYAYMAVGVYNASNPEKECGTVDIESWREGSLHKDVTMINFTALDGVIEFTAKAKTGYKFKGWYEGVIGSSYFVEYPTDKLLSDEPTYTCDAGPEKICAVFECAGHDWQTKTCKATFDEPGCIYQVCKVCGTEETVAPLLQVTKVSLEATSFTYTGKEIKPKVTVANSSETLSADCYDVEYSNNVNVGTAKVKITLKGDYYEGSKTLTFQIKAKTSTPTPTKAADVSLTLNKTSANVICGDSLTLKATLKGASGKVSWKSSNTKIATVDTNGKITAKQAGAVTITASASGKSATCKVQVLFKDVTNSKDFWYEPTYYLANKDVVKGYDNQTTFKPGNECTRAQMMTFMYRLAGNPATKASTCNFEDVKSTDYFYKPVIWAVEQGITTGVSKTSFNPQGVCTRAQTVTFLWRMAGKPEPGKNAKNFSDVKKTDYFYKATLWASDKKILAGYDDGTFKPQGKCLRRQMVTFLYKYDKYVNGKG